jgi:hypothetical protein
MAFIEQCLQLKKVTFNSDKIILHKRKGDIIILLNEVDRFDYTIPSLHNYLLAVLGGGIVPGPGYFMITLRRPHVGKKGAYVLKLKYDDYCRLPGDYLMKMNCN